MFLASRNRGKTSCKSKCDKKNMCLQQLKTGIQTYNQEVHRCSCPLTVTRWVPLIEQELFGIFNLFLLYIFGSLSHDEVAGICFCTGVSLTIYTELMNYNSSYNRYDA